MWIHAPVWLPTSRPFHLMCISLGRWIMHGPNGIWNELCVLVTMHFSNRDKNDYTITLILWYGTFTLLVHATCLQDKQLVSLWCWWFGKGLPLAGAVEPICHKFALLFLPISHQHWCILLEPAIAQGQWTHLSPVQYRLCETLAAEERVSKCTLVLLAITDHLMYNNVL